MCECASAAPDVSPPQAHSTLVLDSGTGTQPTLLTLFLQSFPSAGTAQTVIYIIACSGIGSEVGQASVA